MEKITINGKNTGKIWLDAYDDSDQTLFVGKLSAGVYVFVEILDMEAYCGRDNDGHPKYSGSTAIVDLSAIGEEEITSALRSCGLDAEENLADLFVAEACFRHGCKAPVWDESSNSRRYLEREGKRQGRAMEDSDTREEALDRPVNQIGSTAREYMVGDLTSAVQRGCERGDRSAQILAKMHGATEEQINDAAPADILPYAMGYLAGSSGSPPVEPSEGEEIAPEYLRGFERGEKVRKGEASAPSWIVEVKGSGPSTPA